MPGRPVEAGLVPRALASSYQRSLRSPVPSKKRWLVCEKGRLLRTEATARGDSLCQAEASAT